MKIKNSPSATLGLDPLKLRDCVNRVLEDNKAEDIVTIDLSDRSSITDYLIIASGTSQRHVSALADRIQKELKILGVRGISIEGKQTCDWVLLDAGDAVVHLFRPEVRAFYNLEKMWGHDFEDFTEASIGS
ncbi:MAG: ribosome silencing factor [bacterium]|nr:ribosome silencing factor [bacterium]